MLTIAIIAGALMGGAAFVIICACRLSGRRYVVVPPELPAPKRVETRCTSAWREEYAAAMRLRDGVGRR